MNFLFYPKKDNKARSHMTLEIPLRKSNLDQKSISFLGTLIWNKLSNHLKTLNTDTSFTHSYKKIFESLSE